MARARLGGRLDDDHFALSLDILARGADPSHASLSPLCSNPFAGLDSIGGGASFRRPSHARADSTDSEASFGGVGGLYSIPAAPVGARSRSGRSSASVLGGSGTAGGRRRNMPASEMSLGGGYDAIVHGGGADASPRRGGKASRAPSIASTHYPTTTTAASKSRRSTLLSQTTAFTDELEPPSASRFKGAYGAYKGPGTHNIPSPPSSVASSAAHQIYPETPAQREARRRSTERSRPVTYSSSVPVAPPLSAILPPRPKPALESAFSGSDRGESSTGATSHYVPTKWKEERELKRGGVDEEFRPQEKDKEWKPGAGDNVKRSWCVPSPLQEALPRLGLPSSSAADRDRTAHPLCPRQERDLAGRALWVRLPRSTQSSQPTARKLTCLSSLLLDAACFALRRRSSARRPAAAEPLVPAALTALLRLCPSPLPVPPPDCILTARPRTNLPHRIPPDPYFPDAPPPAPSPFRPRPILCQKFLRSPTCPPATRSYSSLPPPLRILRSACMSPMPRCTTDF